MSESCSACGGPNIGLMYAHRPGCEWRPIVLTQDCDYWGCRGTDNQYICRRCGSTGQTNRERDRALLHELTAEASTLRAALASLKERQLTRYEAESVLMSLERKPFKGPEIDARYDAERRAKAKLRLLSPSDSEQK